MATIRDGNRLALLVVDVQVGVMAECDDAARVVANVARAVARARAAGRPVLWVQHGDDELVPGSAPWQWVPELMPAPGEARIAKRHNSAFEDTALEAELARLGVSHLVLAGAVTNWCIRATAYAALDRGYDLTLLQDAHAAGGLARADGTSIPAPDLIGDLNAAMTWLSYPGRRNRAVGIDAFDFGAL